MRLIWSICVTALIIGGLCFTVWLKSNRSMSSARYLIPVKRIRVPDWKKLARRGVSAIREGMAAAENPASPEAPSGEAREVAQALPAIEQSPPHHFAGTMLFLREAAGAASQTTEAMLKAELGPEVESAPRTP